MVLSTVTHQQKILVSYVQITIECLFCYCINTHSVICVVDSMMNKRCCCSFCKYLPFLDYIMLMGENIPGSLPLFLASSGGGTSEWDYSKTSNSRPSEKQTTSLERTYQFAPNWFYHRTNAFQNSEKRAPLNSIQWTMMSSRLTLANTKLPLKTDSETTPTKFCT